MENNLVLYGEQNNIDNLRESKNLQFYTTIEGKTREDKVKLYNALQSCDVRINDIKGQKITIVILYIEKRKVEEVDNNGDVIYDSKTGEIKEKDHFRCILFGDDGKTYVSSAYGVYNSLSQIIRVFGNPSEDNKITVEIGEKPVKNSNYTTLVLKVVDK